ncbi:MAG: 3-keto-disaccharide hydrolase [Chloroflexota bacterium]
MAEQPKAPVGYSDTPLIPGSEYRVHDSTRPQPTIVTPGTSSIAAAAGLPPSDAVILFDGSDLSGWTNLKGEAAAWKVANGYMEVAPRSGDIRTVREFGDCQLHVEWAAPGEVKGDSQGRGNSGVFLMGRYEIQVLDCYDNPTYADGTAAAIYGEFPPLVNPSRKPGEWQFYDIIWTAPRFDGEKLVAPAYLTMLFNGVLVHNHRALVGQTSHRKVDPWVAHPATGPLKLQDHGNPMRFRNIWYRPLGVD